MSSQTVADVHWNPNNCLAIVGTTGLQCSATAKDSLCGTHDQSRSVTRVDEFDTAPNEDLRDELIEECDMAGPTAYALATAADDIEDLWHLVTGLQDVQIGADEWSADRLAMKAEDIAEHPDLDVDGHPLADPNCAAFPASSTSVGDRCTSGGHGVHLLCGLHIDTEDPETIYDDEHLDEDLEAVPLAEPVQLYEDDYRLDDVEHEPDTEFVLVDERGDDAIVVTPETVLKRIPLDCLETESQDGIHYRSLNRSTPDDRRRPALFDRVVEGDEVRLRLDDNSFVRGAVDELHEKPQQFAMLLETDDEHAVPVISNREDDGWGPSKARDTTVETHLGEVVGVLVLEEAVAVTRDLAGATITLVGCGDDKLDEPAPARDLYQSNYFKLKRQYAEERAPPWFILSALYGLVDPAEVVLPYDKSLDDEDVDDEYLKEWDLLVAEQCPDIGHADVEILAGSTYVDAVRETFEMYTGTDGSFSAPTSGGLPARMKWLGEHTGDDRDETDDVQEGATFVCEDCEDRVEDSPMPMRTCAFCGGDMVLEDEFESDSVDEEAVQERREVYEAAGLPERQAEIRAQKDLTDRTHAEIADELGLAKGTIDQHSARAASAIEDVDDRIADLEEEIEKLRRLKAVANNTSIDEYTE